MDVRHRPQQEREKQRLRFALRDYGKPFESQSMHQNGPDGHGPVDVSFFQVIPNHAGNAADRFVRKVHYDEV
jgi:hypothetical protein